MKTLKHFLTLLIVSILPFFISNCEKVETTPQPSESDFKSAFKSTEFNSELYLEEPVTVFGPEEFVRDNGKPIVIVQEIPIEDFEPIQDYFRIIVSTGHLSSDKSLSSAVIKVNGEEIFGPSDFKNNPRFLEQIIESTEDLFIEVEVNGKPGDIVTIEVEGFLYSQNSILFSEQAFPGITGEIVEFYMGGSKITCELIEGKIVYQGDIILNEEQVSSSVLKGAAVPSSLVQRWPNKTVIYTVAEDLPRQRYIRRAIRHWEDNTTIEFIKRTDEENYIEFIESEGSWSEFGMIGWRQEIGLADWAETGTVIHEIGHALGLIHEQSRSNREEYIIVTDNVREEKSYNYEILSNSINTTLFDFGSIMIYSSYSTEKMAIDPDLPNMTKLDGSTWEAQRKELSESDIAIVEYIYSNECIPNLITPINGAVLDNGCSDNSNGITWQFDWDDCDEATMYHIIVSHLGAIPAADLTVTNSEFTFNNGGYIVNRNNWSWKVRSMVGGEWGEWSELRLFGVEPLNTDCL